MDRASFHYPGLEFGAVGTSCHHTHLPQPHHLHHYRILSQLMLPEKLRWLHGDHPSARPNLLLPCTEFFLPASSPALCVEKWRSRPDFSMFWRSDSCSSIVLADGVSGLWLLNITAAPGPSISTSPCLFHHTVFISAESRLAASQSYVCLLPTQKDHHNQQPLTAHKVALHMAVLELPSQVRMAGAR